MNVLIWLLLFQADNRSRDLELLEHMAEEQKIQIIREKANEQAMAWERSRACYELAKELKLTFTYIESLGPDRMDWRARTRAADLAKKWLKCEDLKDLKVH